MRGLIAGGNDQQLRVLPLTSHFFGQFFFGNPTMMIKITFHYSISKVVKKGCQKVSSFFFLLEST